MYVAPEVKILNAVSAVAASGESETTMPSFVGPCLGV